MDFFHKIFFTLAGVDEKTLRKFIAKFVNISFGQPNISRVCV